MKNLGLTVVLLSFFNVIIFSQGSAQPEFYMNVKDNPGAYYKIYASKFGITPIYDGNFSYTTEYNEQYDKYDTTGLPVPFYAGPDNFTANKGFDWAPDILAGEDNRGILGCGLYRIEFFRIVDYDEISVFYFYFDTRISSWPWSPDVFFYLDYNQGTTHFYINYPTKGREIQEGDTVELWTELGLTKNWIDFMKTVTISNDFEGSVKQDISTQLQDAPEGFPETQYNSGYNFIPGSNADFWKGATYSFSVSDQLQYFNDKAYKSRNWNYVNKFGNTITTAITTNELKAFFYPTQPLTVTNNLEGGTGGSYTVTWDKKPSEPATLNTGAVYNAFDGNVVPDNYTLEAYNQATLNTNWYFLNWMDGPTSASRNVVITEPKTFTANYKGNLVSNQSDGFSSNGQRKIVRDNSGYYHSVYFSQGGVWYTKSTTTNFDGNWIQDTELFPNTYTRNPSIDVNGNDFAVVAESNDETATTIILYRIDGSPIYVVSYNLDAGYYGNSYPVISKTNNELFIVYKTSATSTLKYRRYYETSVAPYTWVWTSEADIPFSTSNSKYPSIVGDKSSDDVYIVWQEGASEIKYLYSHRQGNNRTFYSSDFQSVSANNGYSSNTNPSISLSYTGPVVSWTASRKENVSYKVLGKETLVYVHRALVRAKASTWGDFTVLGSEVNYTNNNSSTSTTGETVIALSQSGGSTSKWVKRVGGYYSAVSSLSHNGLQVNVSNGTSLANVEAMVFNTASLPYPINRSTTSFTSLSKIATDTTVTYGRTGVVGKQGIEFLFCVEDILLDDENIKFTERVDTLPVLNLNELNSAARTNTFNLNVNSNLYFSLYYLVINPELASSVLTDEDYINFKLELVNANNNLVVGAFDDITFTKQNVYDHENISYKIDCAGIEEGSYFLRIAADANSSTGLSITNNQNDAGMLGKTQYTEINYTGNTIPIEYALAQNFPNPFNPSTTIRYQLPKDGIITLKIYDILGSEVTTLINEEKVAGRYEVNFNASSLASGVYIYKIQAGDFVNSKKMILLK